MKVVIDKFNVNTGFTEKRRSLMYSSLLWHKIMVENVQDLDRDFVLKTLMNAVHPLDFIPVSYEACPEHASFLLKNCGAALEYLCRHNLVVQNPNNMDKPFIVSIELCFASANDLKINVQSNVVCVIQKRLSTDGVLNLEQFYKDPSLNEFCPLSQPKLMFFILHLSKSYNVKVLKLANNQIEILKPLEAVYGVKSIVSLDLRNNNINNISELKALKDLSITELWLDGNPVCKEYDEFTYGRAMQEIISGLAKLDGFTITKKGGFMPFRRNFLCNIEGQELVDQFLEHYFTIYDSPNRNALNGVYHKQALFSLTSRYLVMQSTSPVARLNSYTQFSRNIKQISDFSKNDLYLFKGPQSILKIFNSLPRTEHDPHTFAVDLMSYTDTTAVIVVTGVFQELYESELNLGKQYGFVRTFVLLAGQNSEYTIVNEQLHVSNATTIQALKAFKIQRPKKMNYIHIPPPQNIKERYELIETMKIITGLNMEWSKNCLEDAQYNLKNALTTFVELYKLDKIPQNAFERENEIESVEQNSLQANLQKIQQTLLIAKDSTRALNKRRKTSAYNLELKSASPVEQVSKLTQPEASTSSSSKSIVQKAEDTDDIFELSYMNDDGISAISDNSESRQEDAGIRNGGPSPAVYNLNYAGTAMAENEGNLLKDALQMNPTSHSRKRRKRKRYPLPSVIVHGTSLPLKSKSKSLRQIVLETSQLHCIEDTALPTSKSKYQETAKVSKNKAAGPIVKLDSTQKKVLEIRKSATLFKTQLQKKNIAKACLIANNLVKKHGSKSLQPWQHILKGFFEISPELARQYVEKGRNILQKNFIYEFNRTCADLECQYGDPKMGENIFEDIIKEQPRRIGAVMTYARFMLKNNRITDAKELLQTCRKNCFSDVSLNKHVLAMEKEFNCILR